MMKKEEHLSEDNPAKGQFLRTCLEKENIIFSRVTPDQKLLVVDACQRLNHIVAVTGDGVNDAPAMKRSDIGIAMNITGTEVTKDAADILILDDNFSNILEGIQRGRTIFDILKRMIGYNLTSNVAEVIPVVVSFIWKFPIPMNAIQILVIDLLSDVYINITYAYERAESDVMDRHPRDPEYDNLCSFKLFGYSYLYFGWIETSAGFIAFFTALNDYGITANGIIGIIHEYGVVPGLHDVYNPDDPYNGNTNAFIFENSHLLGIEGEILHHFEEEHHRMIDYLTEEDALIDMRVMLYELPDDTWTECTFPGLPLHSEHGEGNLCWSLEAVRHAQTAFFANIIMTQFMNGICYRTITVSLFVHIMDNWDCNIGYFVVQGVMAAMLYVPGLNNAFGCRPLIIQHWIPCLGIWITLFIFSEVTKYLIRNVKEPDGSPGFFSRRYKY